MSQIDLYFRSCDDSLPALIEVAFRRSFDSPVLRTVRGKFCYIVPAGGSFQWTRAVKALTVLLLRTAIHGNSAIIRGETGSLAASLDYALSKEPTWLSEMFGADSQGRAFARRLFYRTNPERKRSGPVIINVNPAIVAAPQIQIYVDGKKMTPSTNLETILKQFESVEKMGEKGEPGIREQENSSLDGETADPVIVGIADLLERTSSSRNLSLKVTDDGLVTSFASLAEADTVLPALMDMCTSESKGSTMYWYLHHAWWPLISPLYCFRHTETSKSVHTNVSYVSPASGATDRYVSNFYANSGIPSRLGSSAFLEHDTWLFNDYIIEQVFPTDLRKEIDIFLSQTQKLEAFNPVSFIRNFLEAEARIELRVRRMSDPKQLRASFEDAMRW
jgi:hypothetical protein